MGLDRLNSLETTQFERLDFRPRAMGPDVGTLIELGRMMMNQRDGKPVVDDIPNPEAWRKDAICSVTDPDIFYPEDGDEKGLSKAKAICHECPAESECLNYAIANGEKFGVWGGKDARERRSVVRARNRQRRKERANSGEN